MSAIHILQLGDTGVAARQVRDSVSTIFRCRVDLKRTHPDLEQFFDSDRGQYNSTSILLHLKSEYAGSASIIRPRSSKEKILAVINADLFIPILTYVFGEAELNGTVAVVSPFRLRNELYGLPSNDSLFNERFLKESLHELGHLYGLLHCSEQHCAMHASTYVEDIDLKGDSFCDRCLDVVRRGL